MGEGLYCDPGGLTVYAEPFEDGDLLDPDDRCEIWRDFEDDVLSCLTPSWHSCDRWRNRANVVAANRLHELTLHEDSYGRAHVTIAVREDLEPGLAALAQAALATRAETIFGRLGKLWPLHVRTSAWTSRPYAAATSPPSRSAA
ncbi:hypothetical protein [Rubrimonas cliftonensis]|uniref:Uncharacterized protein n=1 Tax=Rubrimonas cliftonensis TaxID=89524 RepID=A0A1H4ES65_9RHOB|nr:hypothetical protein [Rubrimonas cliftonensis]SEA87458.1 hypothetical protein SAMN05444370_11551 [Rubrimonas cliftonensis]